jgi:hypothetical protein
MDESPDHEPTLIERGMGVHLNQPNNSSMRNTQFATRSMGVVDTSPLCPAKGRRRDVKIRWRAPLDRLNWAQARGLDAWVHFLETHRTQAYAKYMRMAPPRPVEILPTPAETNTSHTGRLCEKTLQEHPRSCKASGVTPAGALARPHGTTQHPGGKNVPSASTSLCGILTDITAKARGLLSGTALGVP